jgi:hypothetical protein
MRRNMIHVTKCSRCRLRDLEVFGGNEDPSRGLLRFDAM